jgi:phosphatidylglycerol:prolipoprotein diacylglycerol transferase
VRRQSQSRAISAESSALEGLSVTHWFDPGATGAPYAAVVRFAGHRAGVEGKPGPHDAFVKEESVEGVVPGSGPVSVTTWVVGLQPGDWTVTAELVRPRNVRRSDSGGYHSREQTLPRAAWSWGRWRVSSGPFDQVRTRWAPLVRLTRMPAVIPGSWTGFLFLGVAVGLFVQAAILAREHVSLGKSLTVTLFVLVAGLVGAKLWYIGQHPGSWREQPAEGWSVHGFLAVAPAVAAIGLIGFQLPVGVFLDASTPGLFFGVAIGRLGCFFTGCCAGQATASPWGVWSSDRRVGARRIPAQLLESASGLLLAALTLVLVLRNAPALHGAILVAGLAIYVLVRLMLLRLRAEAPRRSLGAPITAAAAVLALFVDIGAHVGGWR